MPQLKSAVKLLKNSKTRGTVEQLFIDFLPNAGRKSFESKYTGADVDQVAENEYDLGWHITLNEDGHPILISHNATEFRLCLRGENGWRNLEELVADYCKRCYSNTILKAEGCSLTPEEFKNLSDFLKEIENSKPYILAKQFKSRARLYATYAYHGKSDSRTLKYVKINNECQFICSIRPTVLLPDDIKLLVKNGHYDGSTPERGLRIGNEEIIEKTDKEKRCAYLRQEIQITREYLQKIMAELEKLENS